MSNLRRRLFGQFAWVSGGRVVAAVLQAVTLLLVARNITPAEFGLLGALLGLATVAQTATSLGVGTFITRERAANPESGAVTTALRFNNISSVLLWALSTSLILLAATTISASFWLLLPLGLWASGERNADTRLSVAFADGDAQINVANLVGRRVLSVALFLGLLGTSIEPLLSYSAAVAAAAVVSSAFAQVYIRRRVTSPASIGYRELLQRSWPFWIHAVMTQLRNLDVAVTGLIAGATQAGFFSAAARLTGPLRILPTSLSSLVLPAASRANAAKESMRPIVVVMVAMTVLMTALYGLLALSVPVVVPMALGESYMSAILPIQIVVCGLPFAAVVSMSASMLQAQGRKHLVALISTVSTVVCLIWVALGAAFSGALGAAIALSASFVVHALALVTISLKLRKRSR